MKTSLALAALALVGAAAATGYWAGQRSPADRHVAGTTVATPAGPAAASMATPASTAAAPRKLLYYRNPMGLPDTSPVPKKDPMGMDYIAVYDGEEPAATDAPGTVRIGPDKVQKLGVRTEPAALRTLARTVRASGRVEPDERRIAMIAPKFEGYVERLHVNATGQPVARGQALFEVYSPELVAAQREFAIARQGVVAMQQASPEALSGMRQLAEASLARLRNWDVSTEELDALVASGEARRTVTLRSPVAGIVTEKKAFQGMRFMPGEALYQVTDLSAVWVVADVPERDIGALRTGSVGRLRFDAYPDQAWSGRVTYVYPTMDAPTRTVPVRIELANPQQRLKPKMFAQVEFELGGGRPVLTVPDSAVIDTGTRQLVLVQRGEGRFEPREVRLGGRGDGHAELLSGVQAGEPVVVAANFLIDAESNLKAVVGALQAAGPADAASAAAAGSPAAATVGHRGTGRVESVDARAGTVTLEHGPIATLKWPAMTMDFRLANPALATSLKPGSTVAFEFVERAAGEWVVTRATPAAAAGGGAAPQPAASAGHAGHR